MAVWSRRIHASGVHRKWLVSSEHWELLNVFSLPHGAAALEELRQQYEVIDKQNEVGKEESMSVAAGRSIGGA